MNLDDKQVGTKPKRRDPVWSRHWYLALAIISLLAGIAAWTNSNHHFGRTYLVGFGNYPPYTVLKSDGSFGGMAIDVLNEAARRKGVSLKWVPVPTVGADQALAQHLVDMWPSVAITPERNRRLHLTRPWNQSNYYILSRKETNFGTPFQGEAKTVAHLAFPMSTQMAKAFLHSYTLQPRKDANEVIRAVCRGDVDAGFLDARILDAALMERPPGCEGAALRVSFVKGAISGAAIASTQEAASAADALRAGITTMMADETLSAIMDRWASFSASEARSSRVLQHTEEKAEITLFALLGLSVLAATLFWQFWRALKLQRITDRIQVLERDRSAVLERLATSETLGSLLEKIAEMVERQYPDMLCTVATRMDESLLLCTPLHLPDNLRQGLMQVKIGPFSCTPGIAAFSKALTVSGPLGSDPGWTDQRSGLERSGIQSCWSIPVCSGTGEVTAVITVYLKARRRPDRSHLQVLESAARLTDLVLQRRQTDEQLQCMATHDSLTGLPNRVLLSDRLQDLLGEAEREGEQFAVFCIDLDRFKQINDTLGHSTGDLFLQQMSKSIQSVLCQNDTLARIGGDEFVLVLPGMASVEGAETLAQRLLDAIRTPLRVDGVELFGSASVGISFYPRDGTSAIELQRSADTAMYAAKKAGKDRYKVFGREMSRACNEALAMERDLHLALENKQFELHYQPQFLASGELVGAEALLRFRHPQLGLIGPDRFIPCAEETGLIVPIGRWVLREACRQLAEWKRLGLPIVRTAINVSAVQLAGDFPDTVYSALTSHGISPSLLEIELTESAVMQSIEESMPQMSQLRTLGVRLAIDDFGTGYSSLSYLQKLPVDAVKIDRSFVREEARSGSSFPLIQAIVAASRSLGLEVVAEGVETWNQHRSVCDAGCDIIQGFLLSRPLSASDMTEFLKGQANTMAEEAPVSALV